MLVTLFPKAPQEGGGISEQLLSFIQHVSVKADGRELQPQQVDKGIQNAIGGIPQLVFTYLNTDVHIKQRHRLLLMCVPLRTAH